MLPLNNYGTYWDICHPVMSQLVSSMLQVVSVMLQFFVTVSQYARDRLLHVFQIWSPESFPVATQTLTFSPPLTIAYNILSLYSFQLKDHRHWASVTSIPWINIFPLLLSTYMLLPFLPFITLKEHVKPFLSFLTALLWTHSKRSMSFLCWVLQLWT